MVAGDLPERRRERAHDTCRNATPERRIETGGSPSLGSLNWFPTRVHLAKYNLCRTQFSLYNSVMLRIFSRTSSRCVVWIAVFLGVAGFVWSACPPQSHAREETAHSSPLRVLVVNSFHQDIPWQRSFERGLRDAFDKSGRKTQVYMEYLDAGRVPASAPLDWFQNYLEVKYRNVGFDVLMSESGPATSFVNTRPGLFSGAKRIYLQPSSLKIENEANPDARSIVINAVDDYGAAITEMQRMVNPQNLYVIADASTPARRRRLDTFKQALDKIKPKFKTVFLVDLTMERLLERVASLPPGSAIFYLLIFRDSAGTQYVPYRAAQLVAERANAPMFSNWESLLGSGIVGGHLISGELLADIAANTALGRPVPQTGPVAYGYYYDARQLRRWNIDASLAPAGAALRFSQPNLFERYRWQIVATFAALTLLTLVAAIMAALNIRLKQAKTDARENEREYRNILDQLQDIFYRTDTDGQIVMVSPSVENVLGYRPNEVMGRQLADYYIHPERRAEFLEELKQGDGKVYGFEGALRHKNGHEVLLSTNAHYRLDDQGQVVGVDGVARDISERRALEEQLRQAQKMRAIGQLTGGIAHDFNNLLAIISGNSELLNNSLRDNKNLAAIQRAAMRGGELTQHLLAFSRQQSLQPRPIDLAALVSGLVGLLGSTLGESTTVDSRVMDGVWPVLADPTQLENALLNLAINARDAMRDGGVLEIGCENVCLEQKTTRFGEPLPAGDYVRIVVRDTGTGMTEHSLSRALEPFYTTKDVGQGSGLGLSMVYGFARQSGGDVVIDSVMGRGTAVTLYLPRAESLEESEDRPDGDELKRGGGQRILVLEDEADVRELAVNALEALGYRVIEAADADQARARLDASGKIDLIVSDVVLPGRSSGPRFVAEAKTRYPGIRAVFMTGYAPESVFREGYLDRGEVILRKPFSIGELARAIYESLGTPSSRMDVESGNDPTTQLSGKSDAQGTSR